MLCVIGSQSEVCPKEDTACVLPDNKLIIQRRMLGGRGSCCNLRNSIKWFILSKALEKSIKMHLTYKELSKRREAWCVKAIKVEVVEPLGLYANWSRIESAGIAGSKYLRTISFSVSRDSIDVTEMGRRWEKSTGGAFFGTAVTRALSQAEGGVPLLTTILMRCVKTGANLVN